jgi:signal recognition particle subunit SEC65
LKAGDPYVSTFEFDDSSLADLGDKHTKVDTADVGGKAAALAAAGTPIAAKKQIYTVMAQQGIDAAAVVNVAMQKRTLGTLTPRRIEVIAPHGPSTSGGKKARQSITLTPVAGGGAAIVFGFLDVAAKGFEVRPFSVVSQQFKARFGEPFEATADEYDALCKDLGKILDTLGFKLSEPRDDTNPGVKLDPRAARAVATTASDYDELEDHLLGGPSKQQKLMMLAAGIVVTIVITLWWLK